MPTKKQIGEIEEYIARGEKAASDKSKGPSSKEAVKYYQLAIDKACEYFKIKLHANCEGKPKYKHDETKGGSTLPIIVKGKPKGRVSIGPKGFTFAGKPSAVMLAANKVHEIYGHCANGFKMEMYEGVDGSGKKHPFPAPNLPLDEDELLAFHVMLEWKNKLGLSEAMKKWIKGWMKVHYKKLSPEKQKEYKKKFPWLALRIPSDGMEGALANVSVPVGTLIQSREGILFTTVIKASLLDLAKTFNEGDIEEFYDFNPALHVELADLRRTDLRDSYHGAIERESLVGQFDVPGVDSRLAHKEIVDLESDRQSKSKVLLRQ